MSLIDVCVAGGGAAGMMCAITAARNGLSVILIEKNEKTGKKLFITGKGRCNITNNCSEDKLCANVVSNPKFLYGAFHAFTSIDCIDFFNGLGLRTKTERGNRVFPESDKASDVIRALNKEMKRLCVDIRLNTSVKELILKKEGDGQICEGVILNSGERILSRSTVIATGGCSYPSTGSDGDGYRLAKSAGLCVTKLRPGLVPMCVKESYAKRMKGLSLKNIGVSFMKAPGGKILHKDFGEMIFTHFGVSGPVILSASSVLEEVLSKDNLILEIDFKPALDHGQLDKRLIRELEEGGKKAFKNILKNLLPASAIPVFSELITDNPDKSCNEVSKKEREALKKALKSFRLTITGLRGFDEAIITRGGVSVKELDPKTMEAKKIRGLFFAGEVIDTDALTGGFNLQIAWSTAVRCGEGIKNTVEFMVQ